MSKNYKEASDYLVSQDKEVRERLEFTKTQGEFFQKILGNIEGQKAKYRFVLEEFHRAALQLPKLYNRKPSDEDEPSESFWECGKLSLYQSIRHFETQDRLKAAYDSIMEQSRVNDPDVMSEYVVIDFAKGEFTWQDLTFSLSHSVVGMGIYYGGMKENFDLPLGERLNAVVAIGYYKGALKAYLKVTWVDREYFFELHYFSLLFLLDEHHREVNEWSANANDKERVEDAPEGSDEEKSETALAEEEEPRDAGVFTLFDSRNEVFFTTTY